MNINGNQIAADIIARTNARAQALERRPTLLALTVEPNAATKSYLRIKDKRATEAGVEMRLVDAKALASTTAELITLVAHAAEDAVLVQLPLAGGFDARQVCDAIPADKDADVLSSQARKKPGALLPPVVGAVAEILDVNDISVSGMRAVVIGDGWLVGNPCAAWLESQGAEVFHISGKGADLSVLALADLIVSGAGDAHVIRPEMIKQGVILLDAGTSESSGVLAGDADPACAAKCALFTPVPGGMGPIAVAKLFENVVTLAERRY